MEEIRSNYYGNTPGLEPEVPKEFTGGPQIGQPTAANRGGI
jgi:hypothetical protein